jgi:zinc and cadmium transporter
MILIYLLLIATVLLAGSVVFIVRNDNRMLMKLLLAFSGAFLIGISFLDLVPEVFSGPLPYAGLFVLAGFLLQLLLELLTRGAEHGHEHDDDCHGSGHVSPFLLLLGLCIHSFLEGMPIVSSYDPQLRNTLVTGIIIHNIPISLTLMSLFVHYGMSRTRALIFLLIFALMTPFGSLFSTFLESVALTGISHYFDYALALVIGIFLHVSTSILFETSENHQYNLRKFTTVVIGLATAYLVVSL